MLLPPSRIAASSSSSSARQFLIFICSIALLPPSVGRSVTIVFVWSSQILPTHHRLLSCVRRLASVSITILPLSSQTAQKKNPSPFQFPSFEFREQKLNQEKNLRLRRRTRSGFLRQLKIPGIFSITNSLLFGMSTDMVRFSPYNVLKEGIYTYWAPEVYQSRWILYIDLQELVSFNFLQLQEPIQMGQRVSEFHLEALQQDDVWKRVTNGTTIGYQRLLLFPKVKSQHLKLFIDKSRADPLISYLGIYMDPVTIWSSIYDDTVLTSHFNATQVIHVITQDNSHTAT
ncbi:Putative alpha-L-fucosidase [Arachis hypogaea]|nr:Putative alpha-L-fucosidase [Arachis hypogaea]